MNLQTSTAATLCCVVFYCHAQAFTNLSPSSYHAYWHSGRYVSDGTVEEKGEEEYIIGMELWDEDWTGLPIYQKVVNTEHLEAFEVLVEQLRTEDTPGVFVDTKLTGYGDVSFSLDHSISLKMVATFDMPIGYLEVDDFAFRFNLNADEYRVSDLELIQAGGDRALYGLEVEELLGVGEHTFGWLVRNSGPTNLAASFELFQVPDSVEAPEPKGSYVVAAGLTLVFLLYLIYGTRKV